MLSELEIGVKALKAINSYGETRPIIYRWEQLIKKVKDNG